MHTHPKFNIAPENGGWKTTTVSYWEGNLSGAMLNFGRVTGFLAHLVRKIPNKPNG